LIGTKFFRAAVIMSLIVLLREAHRARKKPRCCQKN